MCVDQDENPGVCVRQGSDGVLYNIGPYNICIYVYMFICMYEWLRQS